MGTCPKQTSDYEFGIIGCQRSGHHAIVSWLARHFKGRVSHINLLNIRRDSSAVLNSFVYKDGTKLKHGPLNEHSKCLIWSIDRFDVNDVNLMSGKHQVKLLDFAVLPNTTRNQRKIIIVMRDPYNWMASRYKAWKERKIDSYGNHAKGIEEYKEHLAEFLNPTVLPKDTIPVNFNYWFMHKDYRESISEELGLEFTDAGLEYVENAGSSFDLFNFQKNGQSMKVLTRYEELRHDDAFVDIFKRHPELSDIAWDHFSIPKPF